MAAGEATDGKAGQAVAARSPRLSPLARAFVRYVARTRDPGVVLTIPLRREVDAEVDAMTDRLFAGVESVLADALADGELESVDGEPPRFDYDTRLVLPAMLTLGRYRVVADDVPLLRRVRTVDRDLVREARRTTAEIVRALVDGDMRDALNDEEYEDFETNCRPKRRVAELAQAHLQAGVEEWFDAPDTPAAVECHYRRAVRLSGRHQERDDEFRDLIARLHDATGETREEAVAAVREQYKFAGMADPPDLFADERDLPYFATQYERVGVLYEGMLDMYAAAVGVDPGVGFKRAIVLMVIAAQVGLDDTDDYPDDRGTQLTPVTAELGMHRGDRARAVATLREVVEAYLAPARAASEEHLTGMAIEYIRQQSLDRLAALA